MSRADRRRAKRNQSPSGRSYVVLSEDSSIAFCMQCSKPFGGDPCCVVDGLHFCDDMCADRFERDTGGAA